MVTEPRASQTRPSADEDAVMVEPVRMRRSQGWLAAGPLDAVEAVVEAASAVRRWKVMPLE